MRVPCAANVLEDRRLLAQLTVTTDQDVIDFNDGETSLREAIFAANIVPGADEIVFDFGHDGPATILLTQGELKIEDALTITGPGAGLLTIDNSLTQGPIFNVEDSSTDTQITVCLSGMTLTGSKNSAIRSVEDLTIDSMIVRGNESTRGGGIYAERGHQSLGPRLEIRNSLIAESRATSADNNSGGGISITGRGRYSQSSIPRFGATRPSVEGEVFTLVTIPRSRLLIQLLNVTKPR